MAVADGGEVLILAPGVSRFGEDDACDDLIRRIGYCGTDRVMEMMRESDELRENLSVVAHLIHGSTEGRFQVTYCAPKLTRAEVEAANYNYGDLDEVLAKVRQRGTRDDDAGYIPAPPRRLSYPNHTHTHTHPKRSVARRSTRTS